MHMPNSTPSGHTSTPLTPQETYNGGYTSAKTVQLRLANGGAGQAGLIGKFADRFIRWRVEEFREEPFLVEWYLGDTTQSLSYLASGYVDVAFTYNEAAELAEVKVGKAVARELVFIDHFYLVGPPSNPADLSPGPGPKGDSVEDIFNKIVGGGNRDVLLPPSNRPPTRFLSRFDKSATNIKESEMFIAIGQVPWAVSASPWYHQYPRFPLQALSAASVLEEYTLTDRGTWLSSPGSVTEKLVVYARGAEGQASRKPGFGAVTVTVAERHELQIGERGVCALSKQKLAFGVERPEKTLLTQSPEGLRTATSGGLTPTESPKLLNPCAALLSSTPRDYALAKAFMDWLVKVDGGQDVVRGFVKNGEVLYAPAVPGPVSPS